MKVHNFSAGPSILPEEVTRQAADAVKELDGSGLSLLEISHRSKAFIDIMDEACSLALELTGLQNKGYKSIFLQGGASLQFLMTAYNLLEKKAGYVNTGTWSNKAIKEAKLFGEVLEIASSKEANFNFIPKGYSIPEDLDYLHLTTNNTIFGTQLKDIPETNIPLAADMSSDIFSRVFDYTKFDLFYAGAQKNMGPAGATLVIIKENLFNKVTRTIPSMLNYQIHADAGSMFNTPPVFAVFTSMLNMRWVKAQGGIEKLGEKNMFKSNLLYSEIDRNSKFIGFAAIEDRSEMNATFNLVDPADGEAFDTLCNSAGISGLKGHRSVGGYRASMYNALPVKSLQVLVDCMQTLEEKN
ncbi:3-phosphoserine/phosphohydroxythreonine transaminase [Flavobacteriaceae bacterium]|jgi:phosphoserine aminotransferase|nr:3-phosphoserine/phosphohydroxythreonine transaminase [Flavobacteriaceae bacterium]|tara:strand:- start:602 stop:1666 length:1065 start_codon:yes stop_codon:yes gene_type:complete